MPRRPRVRSSKLKVIVVWLFSVEKRSERRRGGSGEGFCNFFFRVQGSWSVKMQRWFGESDDQYGKYDLRISGLAAESDAKQGFGKGCLVSCERQGRGKDIRWM